VEIVEIVEICGDLWRLWRFVEIVDGLSTRIIVDSHDQILPMIPLDVLPPSGSKVRSADVPVQQTSKVFIGAQ
jgi:hypothetical protein